ncbi:MAG: glycosyltransferase family 39 protein [Chloroflexi bacterium]|nr:glycosyltransferase family 39 protein [Chloroflexota bacterium]
MKYRLWLLLILLTAVFLRLYAIADAPPGLTHDEADHGMTAWEIVNGARAIYFTVGYGREPLYDYATAVLMTFIGPTYLTGRVTAVFFSLILIAGMAAWTRRVFDEPTALLTAAELAVGFWPVMAGRQALRSITLPALFVLAALLWQRGVGRFTIYDLRLTIGRSIVNRKSSIVNFVLAGLFLGATFYTYIPARALWGVFPALLLFAAWRQRPFLRRVWRGTTLMLLVAALVAAPLLYFLFTHPEVEVRIDELSVPLTAVSEGNFKPLLDNARASLRLFTVEGDSTWRYNIPGRPFLQPIMGGLFYLGLFMAAARLFGGEERIARGAFLALAWLLTGLSPVLVTGPDLSMTQAIGMQPVLYLFPALALVTVMRILGLFANKNRESDRIEWPQFYVVLLVLLFGATAVVTFRDYFTTWANAPEVRVQYEATMAAAMAYLNENGTGETAVSTITPARYHSPAVAQLTLHNEAVSLHWFDAQRSLLLPSGGESAIILPGFTPLSPALADYLGTAVLADTLSLRSTDLDRPLTIYRVDGDAMRADWRKQFNTEPGTLFGEAAVFLGYDLLTTTTIRPGDTVQLATLWRVERPLDGAILFTHLLGPDGVPIAQADRLDAPGDLWRAGDWFIQLHEFAVPADTAVGDYPLVVGIYTCPGGVPCSDGQRLTTPIGGDSLYLTQLSVIQ